MFFPYVTIGDDLEVVQSEWSEGKTVVRFEKPDEVYCFKVLECSVPGYKVDKVIGFSEQEVGELINFCKVNSELLIKYSKCGGIANA